MIRAATVLVVLLFVGCAQFRTSFHVFPPGDVSKALAHTSIIPGKTHYEMEFIPRYPILYDVKFIVRHYPLPYFPDHNIKIESHIYRGGTLIGICKSTLGPGWWSEKDIGFYFCAMSSLNKPAVACDDWEFIPNKYGNRFLVPNVTYKLVLDIEGDVHQFLHDYSPITAEISSSSQWDISM